MVDPPIPSIPDFLTASSVYLQDIPGVSGKPSCTQVSSRSLDRRDERIEVAREVRVGVRADQAVLPPGLVRALRRVVRLDRREDALRRVLSRVGEHAVNALGELFSRDVGEGVGDEGSDLGGEVGGRLVLGGADGGGLQAVEGDVGARPGGDRGSEVRPDELPRRWLAGIRDLSADRLFLDMRVGERSYVGEGREERLREVDDEVEL